MSERELVEGELIDTPQVTGSALALLTKAEVDMQVSTAHAYPRRLATFKAEARSMATLDEETAASCFFVLKRGGKPIEGPSVRLAEIVSIAWGNLRCAARIIEIGDKFLTAQGLCHDLEKNVVASSEVQRRITTKTGGRFTDDMIAVTANAACAIARRNAIFQVVPRAYVNELFRAAREVAVGTAKTLVAKRTEMVAYFAKMAVGEPQILEAVGKASLEEIGLAELALLKGLATAIKDGETTVDEAFPAAEPKKSRAEEVRERLQPQPKNGSAPQPAPVAEAVLDKLNRGRQAAAAPTPPAPPPAPEAHDPPADEPAPPPPAEEPDQQGMADLADDLHDLIGQARHGTDLDRIYEKAQALPEGLAQPIVDRLNERRRELAAVRAPAAKPAGKSREF